MILKLMDGLVVEDRTGSWLSKRWRHALLALPEDNGQALIEFAFVAPLFLVVVTGIFMFGIAFNNWEVMTEATNVGARTVAISRGQTLDPCQTAVLAIEAASPNLKPSSLTFSFSFNGVAYSGTSCSSSSSTTGAAGNLLQGQTAQVNVTYPCNLQLYKTNYAPSCFLHAQTTELVQ